MPTLTPIIKPNGTSPLFYSLFYWLFTVSFVPSSPELLLLASFSSHLKVI